jgi:hypothetical protein
LKLVAEAAETPGGSTSRAAAALRRDHGARRARADDNHASDWVCLECEEPDEDE